MIDYIQPFNLDIMKDLYCDVMLGKDFQHHDQKLIFKYGSHFPEMVMKNTEIYYALEGADVEELTLFPNITSNLKPLATKSRHFSEDNQKFIDMEMNKHLGYKIIEPSILPWCAQVDAVKDKTRRHRKRLCLDYS